MARTTSIRQGVSSSGSGELLTILVTRRSPETRQCLCFWNQIRLSFKSEIKTDVIDCVDKETKTRGQGHFMVRGPPASSQCT